MIRFLAFLLFSGAAVGATVGELEPASGTWRVYRGSSFSTYVCSANSETAALDCASKDADARKTSARYQIRYPNRYVTVTYTLPTTCTTPKPDSQTVPQPCPTGTGTWTQTSTYSQAPYPQCWIAEWLPASPPADACKAPEPTGLLFSDDFGSGLTKTANGFKWSGSGTNAQVVDDSGSASGKALRFRFKAAASGQDSHAEQRFVLPNLKDVWIQYTVVIPLNYLHRNDEGADNNKALRLWYGNKSDGNDGYSSYVIKGGFSTLPSDRLIPEWGPPGVGQRDAPTASGWITSEDRGKQVTFTFHVKTDTKCTGDPKTTGGNGALEAWKGEKRIVSYRELCWPSKGYGFDRGYAWGWANSGFAQQTDILMRKFSVATSNVYGVQ
jgi:hypothetical protein